MIKLSILITALTILLLSGCNKSNSIDLSRSEVIRENWKLILNDIPEKLTGDIISQKEYSTNKWHNAVVPGTVAGSLVADSTIIDPYFGINLKAIDSLQFTKPWWYRTTFNLNQDDMNKSISLRFMGINYRANLWINGKEVVQKDKLGGAFNIFTFKINDYIKNGENVIALEVWPPVAGDYTIGFVDWNPFAPDKSMGIFRDVILEINGGITMRSPFVQSKVDKITLDAADLSLQVELENNTENPITGIVSVDYSLGQLEQKVTINGGEKLSCKFTPDHYPQLKVKNVKLWWPNGMGDPNLYDVEFKFIADNNVLNKVSDKYGIREIDSYVDDSGNRVFKINGQFTLIRGAGWVDDLLLKNTDENIEAQIKYVKEMNLNCIRLEGIWGKDETMFDLCDENGILMMVGWSCQWEHSSHLNKPTHVKYAAFENPEDIKLLTSYGESQFLWLRNHPSIFVWMTGSDKFVDPQIEKNYIKFFNEYDTSRPYVASAAGVNFDLLQNDISGPTGMKMLGPYNYTPPNFWYTDTIGGGAYGFNTETSPGVNIPILASLKKMIPADYLWPIENNEYWKYHCNRQDGYFNNLEAHLTAIRHRYGYSKNVEEFAFKSQLMSYELMRPMFEAFIANKPKSTGIIQWMLNSAWPQFYWQLYDSYLQPNAAFYAVKKANNPVHAIYCYAKNDIYIANNTLDNANNLKVSITLIDVNSKVFLEHQWEGVAAANSSSQIFKLPDNITLPEVYFINLIVMKDEKEIDNGVYWMSKKEDITDYEGYAVGYRPSKQFADFSGLNKLPMVKLDYDYKFEKKEDKGNVTIKVKNNNSSIAFFTFFDVVNKQNEPVLPILWDDNYVTILPGEERVYHANYSLVNCTEKPIIKIKGFNVQSEVLN